MKVNKNGRKLTKSKHNKTKTTTVWKKPINWIRERYERKKRMEKVHENGRKEKNISYHAMRLQNYKRKRCRRDGCKERWGSIEERKRNKGRINRRTEMNK